MPRDVSDVLREDGGDAVRELLDGARVLDAGVRSDPSGKAPRRGANGHAPAAQPAVHDGAALLKGRAPEREWLIEGWIPACIARQSG